MKNFAVYEFGASDPDFYKLGTLGSNANQIQFTMDKKQDVQNSQNWGTDYMQWTTNSAPVSITEEKYLLKAPYTGFLITKTDDASQILMSVQVKDDGLLAIIPKSGSSIYIFAKKEQKSDGHHVYRGIFITEDAHGDMTIAYNTDSGILMTLSYYNWENTESYRIPESSNSHLGLTAPDNLISFTIKYSNSQTRNFLVRDSANYLSLTTDPSTAKHCTVCWKRSEMFPYNSWDARGSYFEQEVIGSFPAEPFILNPSTSQCELECDPKYWSNINSSFNTAADEYDQRCTSNNCKNWDYNANSPQKTAKICTQCWYGSDIFPYRNWDGYKSYTEQEMIGFLKFLPFTHNYVTHQCELRCDPKYWSNWKSGVGQSADEYDQRCTSNNCKTWDYSISTATAKNCKTCWTEADIFTDYNSWDAKNSYLQQELVGRLQTEPFKLDPISKKCDLQCQTTYWSNLNSKSGKAADELDQRCTSDNCKNWNYANISVDYELDTYMASIVPVNSAVAFKFTLQNLPGKFLVIDHWKISAWDSKILLSGTYSGVTEFKATLRLGSDETSEICFEFPVDVEINGNLAARYYAGKLYLDLATYKVDLLKSCGLNAAKCGCVGPNAISETFSANSGSPTEIFPVVHPSSYVDRLGKVELTLKPAQVDAEN
jgi:hypothetical protein